VDELLGLFLMGYFAIVVGDGLFGSNSSSPPHLRERPIGLKRANPRARNYYSNPALRYSLLPSLLSLSLSTPSIIVSSLLQLLTCFLPTHNTTLRHSNTKCVEYSTSRVSECVRACVNVCGSRKEYCSNVVVRRVRQVDVVVVVSCTSPKSYQPNAS
jgi:hypothetical protein